MEYRVNFAVLDFETGGLSAKKNPATEIAVVVLDNDLNVIKEYETLIKPYGNLVIERQALEVTGLTLEEINKGKDSKQVVLELIDLFKSLKVGKFTKPITVGHNIEKFDINFLVELFAFNNKDVYEVIDSHMEDTMYLSRIKWGYNNEMPDFKLGSCCQRAGVELVNSHRALADTRSTAKLFTYLMKSLRNENVGEAVKEKRVRETFKF